MKNELKFLQRLVIAGLAISLFGFGGAAIAQTDSPAAASASAPTKEKTSKAEGSSVSDKDKMFVKKAAKGGMMEVALGKLAEQNAKNEDVKSFGQRMVTDHSKANDELKSIAESKGLKMPSKKPEVNWKNDKAYMAMMVKDHEKDLAEFQEEGQQGNDPQIKEFAEKTAKIIEEHLNLAKETQSKLQ